MTLYRTSHDAKIIGYLCDAARNGKQVAVVVELKARFDEAANIQFANRLEDFGIHVTYGVVGFKTHSKVILVVRQDYNGLRRYAHIGTGNYHPGTARLYTDFGLLTCDDAIGRDLTELFNYLTTRLPAQARLHRSCSSRPKQLKNALLEKIEREIAVQAPAGARPHPVEAQRARGRRHHARALSRRPRGVTIDLIVRDTCRLRPGVPGPLRERPRGQHHRPLPRARPHLLLPQRRQARVLHRLGRRDAAQPRESRVEVVAPVEDPLLRRELRVVLDAQLKPNRCQWEMQSDGTYVNRGTGDSARAASST